MLTTHVYLVPRWRMSGALPLLHLCVFMAWTVTAVPFMFTQYVCPTWRDSARVLSGCKSMSGGKYVVFLAATETTRGFPSLVVSPSFGMRCCREAKPQLTLGFPLLINSISLNVITFARRLLDQQLMLPNRAEFMCSLFSHMRCLARLKCPMRSVSWKDKPQQFVCTPQLLVYELRSCKLSAKKGNYVWVWQMRSCPTHALKKQGGRRGVAPPIPNLGSRFSEWSTPPQRRFTPVKWSQYPLGGLVVPITSITIVFRRERFQSLPGCDPRMGPTRVYVLITTTLCRPVCAGQTIPIFGSTYDWNVGPCIELLILTMERIHSVVESL